MPFDQNGRYVADLQPPTPTGSGVAAEPPPPGTGLNPNEVPVEDVSDPNTRPLVTAAGSVPAPSLPDPTTVPGPGPAGAAPVAASPAAPPAKPARGGGTSRGLEGELRQANAGERAAVQQMGEAESAADILKAEAASQAQAEHERQADAARVVREQHTAAANEAHAQTEEALKKARDTKIPEFFGSEEGKATGAAVAITLGGIAQGLLGTNQNGAYGIIQDNVDRYYRQQKERVDNLYKYAEAKGRMEDSLRLKQGQELAELQAQHGATNLAIADHINQVANESQGRVDRTKAAALSEQLRTQGVKDIEQSRLNLAHLALLRAQANEANAKAATAGTLAIDLKEVKPIATEFDKDEALLKGTARTPGLVMKQQQVRELGNGIREAAASGNPQAIAGAIVAAKEQIARLNTGAAPSHEQMKLLEGLSGSPAEVQEKVARLLGNPTAAQQTVGAVLSLIDQSDEHLLQQLDKARGGIVTKYLGTNGIARTPAQRQHALGRIAGVTSQVTTRTPTGEVPRYQEGGAPATSEGPAALSGADAQAKAWADANPNDPRAGAIRKRLGL